MFQSYINSFASSHLILDSNDQATDVICTHDFGIKFKQLEIMRTYCGSLISFMLRHNHVYTVLLNQRGNREKEKYERGSNVIIKGHNNTIPIMEKLKNFVYQV